MENSAPLMFRRRLRFLFPVGYRNCGITQFGGAPLHCLGDALYFLRRPTRKESAMSFSGQFLAAVLGLLSSLILSTPGFACSGTDFSHT